MKAKIIEQAKLYAAALVVVVMYFGTLAAVGA